MLRIRDLRADGVDVRALDTQSGECVVIMGASGTGKSLMLRAIADLDPNDGEVSLNGSSRDNMPANEWRRRVALVPAESGWWADIVGEHLATGSNTDKLLADLGLPAEALRWTVSRLSTGERHRLAIVRALSHKPDVLLLDEPSSSLDQSSNERLEIVLKRLLGEGVSIVLITHDSAQAERLGDRTLTMTNGRLVDQSMTAG